MSIDKIADYNTTPADNVDVGNVAITGASSIRLGNDAIQTLMSHLAKVNAGTDPVADTWTFGDPSDLTKRARLDAGNVTAGQTRVLSMPDADLDFAGLATQAEGDILYRGASAWQRLAKGTAGQYLRQNAALTAPEWASGWELISSVTPSNAANAVWTDLDAFRALRLEGFVRPATDGVSFFLRSSTNNGSSYDSGATDYGVMRMSQQTTTVSGGTTQAAYIPLNVGISVGNGATEGLMFDVQIEQFNQATYMWVQGTNTAIDTTGNGVQEKIGGWRTSTTARNALAVGFTSGNIAAGRIDLWGRRG